jgi:hypothetical protein
MINSGQFWQDVELAICTLMLQELLRQIILEGRNTGQALKKINKAAAALPVRGLVLFRYHEVMMARKRHYNGQMSV